MTGQRGSNGLRLTCRTPWTTLHRPAARREATPSARRADSAAGPGGRQPKAACGQVQPLVVQRLKDPAPHPVTRPKRTPRRRPQPINRLRRRRTRTNNRQHRPSAATNQRTGAAGGTCTTTQAPLELRRSSGHAPSPSERSACLKSKPHRRTNAGPVPTSIKADRAAGDQRHERENRLPGQKL